MPSEKILAQKKQLVSGLVEEIKNSSSGVLVDYKGITVADDTKLRTDLRKAGVHYAVIKNTLIRFAIKEADLEELDGVLNGTTALAISGEDMIAPAKILSKFAETHKNFTIKGGYVDGKALSVEEVTALAKLPSKEVLIAKVLGGFNAPIAGFANVLNGTMRGLVCALNAIAEKQSA